MGVMEFSETFWIKVELQKNWKRPEVVQMNLSHVNLERKAGLVQILLNFKYSEKKLTSVY
jgi:hypothetical protein